MVSVHSLFFFLGNPNLLGRIVSWSLGVCLVLATGVHVSVNLNTDQMEFQEGEQHIQYPVERHPNAYRSIRDYRHPPWYAPPTHPQYASSSQPQPPQSTSPIEQAILNLTKLVGEFVREQKTFNAQLSQIIHTVESSLNHKLDVLQSELNKKIDILQYSISRLTNQHDHKEEENCLIDTILGEQAQLQLQEELKEEPAEALEELQDVPQLCVVFGLWRRKEEILPLISEEGSGKEAGEEPQKPTP